MTTISTPPIVADRKILFIGLGQIGMHLATHLNTAGAELTVCNRTLAKAIEWSHQTGGRYIEHPLVALSKCDIVITCVGDDGDLKAIFSDDFLAAIQPGTLIIDHTTASAEGARVLSQRIKTRQSTFVDAPVSGGSSGAAAKKLAIMVGADDERGFSLAQSVMSTYAARIIHVGAVGSGQVCKMANQLCIAGALEGVAEGLGLALAAGLDPKIVVSAITGGAGQSWQLENRSSFMIQKAFAAGFAAKLMSKDLNLAIGEAHSLGVHTPVGKAVRDQYKKLIDNGFGNEDFSNLFRLVID
jgi:3-hydroxyisobutyrate dehydrogenase-like beta-hydroxyacid dehydrogenase